MFHANAHESNTDHEVDALPSPPHLAAAGSSGASSQTSSSSVLGNGILGSLGNVLMSTAPSWTATRAAANAAASAMSAGGNSSSALKRKGATKREDDVRLCTELGSSAVKISVFVCVLIHLFVSGL